MAEKSSYRVPRETLGENEQIDENMIKRANRSELNGKSLFVKALGIDLTKENDPVPDTGFDVPRMFLVKNGKIARLKDEKIEVGSKAFWESAMKGQLFAYRAGEKHPVQINARKIGGATLKVSVTDPLDPNKLPSPEAEMRLALPKKPRWYHRMFKFGGNRKLCDAYDKALAEDRQWQEKWKKSTASLKQTAETIHKAYGAKRTADFLGSEKIEKEQMLKKYAEEQAFKKAKSDLQSLQKPIVTSDRGVRTAMSLYQPKPVRREECVKVDADNRKGGAYTEEEFKLLKPIEKDLGAIKIGDKGVSDLEFSSLAMFAASAPKIAVSAQKMISNVDEIKQGLRRAGFTERESGEVIAGCIPEIYCRSMMHDRPRADTGKFIQPAIQPGRESALEALEAYQRGDKKPLAGILARAVGNVGQASHRSDTQPADFFAYNRMGEAAVDLMERDPALKELARQEYEARENEFHRNHPDLPRRDGFDEQIHSIRQTRCLEQIREDARLARCELLDARVNGRELTEEEKRKHVKTIMKESYVRGQYRTANALMISDKPNSYNGGNLKLNALVQTMPESKLPLQGSLGNVGGSSMPVRADTVLQTGLASQSYPKPEILSILDNHDAMKQLDQRLDALIEKEGLAKPSTRELSDTYTDVMYTPVSLEKLPERLLAAAPPEKPAREQAAPEKAQNVAREQEQPAAKPEEKELEKQPQLTRSF